MRVTKSKLYYPPFGGENHITVVYDANQGAFIPPEFRPSTAENWINYTILPITESSAEFGFTLEPNNGTTTRTATVTFNDDMSGGSISITIIQVSVIKPIWADFKYLAGASVGQNYPYKIKMGDDIIYEGVSVPAANEIPESINVSRIVESYVSSYDFGSIPGDNYFFDLGCIAVDFYTVSGDTETYRDTFMFTNDWSGYVTGYSNIDKILNDPINHKGCSQMKFPLCYYNATDKVWTLVNQTSTQTYTSIFPTNNYPFGICNKTFVSTNTQTLSFKCGDDVMVTYDLQHCGNGALYYRNRFGGWDGYLLEGNIKKSEKYTKQQFTSNGENTKSSSWGTKTDKNSIVTSYETTTGWLSDEESDRFVYHLLSSPTVYFQPFEADPHRLGDMISVNITNTTAEYKKFKNGRNLVKYTITFDESKTKQICR